MMISPQAKLNVGRTFPFYYVDFTPGRTSIFRLGALFILFLLSFSNLTAQTRIGLHVTQEELDIWRERSKTVPYLSKTGPYQKVNDVSTNSPGDWDRILANANAFVSNPSAERWKGNSSGGCIQFNSALDEPLQKGIKLKDAAFAFLITSDQKYLNAVRNEILAQISEPLTDFTNKSRWCSDVATDKKPGFHVADWLVRVLVGYDYIRSSISSTDRQKIDRWFQNAASFYQREIDKQFSGIYIDRDGGNYNLTEYGVNSGLGRSTAISHYGGRNIPTLAKYYNNRRGSMVRFYTLVGIQQNNSTLKESGKAFFKEWLKFSTFPDGIIGEFERWTSSNPDLGWAYASYIVTQMMNIADHFARAGDMELYKYTTSDGQFGTQGGSKNLHLTIKNLMNHLDGKVKRYATNDSRNANNSNYLIDGVHASNNWYAVNDLWLAGANVYFKDSYIKGVYTRTASGTDPYPTRTASAGPYLTWTGPGGMFPGILLMFGQMEGKVWPYYNGSGSAPINPPDAVKTPTTNPNAKTTITVNARGTSARFKLLVNGLSASSEISADANWKSHNFTVNVASDDISTVMVHFTNGTNTDLYVKSIVVGGKEFSPNSSSVTYDKGSLDGKDVVSGTSGYDSWRACFPMYWSGGLQFKISNVPAPPPSDDDDDDDSPPVVTNPNDSDSENSIMVNAKGTVAGGTYAKFKVLVNGDEIGESTTSNSWKAYSFKTNVSPSNINSVVVQFTNDANINGQDRNLYVESIIVGGQEISATASNVKYDKNELDGEDILPPSILLPWNGGLVFDFSDVESDNDNNSTPPSGGEDTDSENSIMVNAKGSVAGGTYAKFKVLVNGDEIGESTTSNSWKAYSFKTNVSPSNINSVVVQFTNDANINGQDRNLYVESIIVGGQEFSSTASNVKYDKGAIDGRDVLSPSTILPWNGGLVFNFSNTDFSARKSFDLNPEIGDLTVDLTVSPNPNPGIFTVAMNVNTESNVSLSIVDMSGRSLYEKSFVASGSISEVINLPSIPAGVYLLRVKCNNEFVTKKFVKE